MYTLYVIEDLTYGNIIKRNITLIRPIVSGITPVNIKLIVFKVTFTVKVTETDKY
jgi:hypothetical protein